MQDGKLWLSGSLTSPSRGPFAVISRLVRHINTIWKMNRQYITVFGATGNIGKELIALLSEAKIPTIAITRNINNAIKLPFIEWTEADMADNNSLEMPLSKSKVVFLLSGASKNFVQEQNNVIEIAKQQGVSHIVKLSSGAADKNSPYYIPKIHGKVEDFLKTSGINWTMLQPNGIMQNWLLDTAESVKKERKIFEATGNGKRSHIDRRDIAEVAFNCLTEPQKHINKTYFLTSEKAVNYSEIAEAISKVINEKVTYIPLSIDEARQQMQNAGMPPFLIDTFISYDTAQRDGKTAIVTDHVRSIIGKPARTVEQFAIDYADKFK